MSTMRDLTGTKFGRLTVVEDCGKRSNKNVVWLCACVCGGRANVRSSSLIRGYTKSCGCILKEQWFNKTLGLYQSTVYRAWARMKSRCSDRKVKAYENYGGRGITVCKRWIDSFSNFYADMGSPKKGQSLDRKDNSKGYSPDNCRWASILEQSNNKRSNRNITIDGVTKTVAEWARTSGVKYGTFRSRIHRGFSAKEALLIKRYGRRAERVRTIQRSSPWPVPQKF